MKKKSPFRGRSKVLTPSAYLLQAVEVAHRPDLATRVRQGSGSRVPSRLPVGVFWGSFHGPFGLFKSRVLLGSLTLNPYYTGTTRVCTLLRFGSFGGLYVLGFRGQGSGV